MRHEDVHEQCPSATKNVELQNDDDDETSKTIGQTGLTTTRKRKATDQPTWEAKRYVKQTHKEGNDVFVYYCLITLVDYWWTISHS